jgi:NAD+ synthase (glutamine-hydrolysing)
MKLIKVAGAALNQIPFGWANNQLNIQNAIADARAAGVTILGLPELCITGYGCEDDFFRPDLRERAWKMLQELLPLTRGMVVSFGLPILHKNKIYNCVALVVDGTIRGFVAKKALANDGIHYEARQFEAWPDGLVEQFEKDGQVYKIGDLYFRIGDVILGFEICEGAWKGKRDGTHLVGKAVDIMFNPSASHFSFGKVKTRRRLVLEGSRAFGCTYVFVNLLGNEAGRAIYDGDVLIAQAGQFAAIGPRFSYHNHVLTTAIVDIEHTRMMQSRTCSFKPEITGKQDERCVEVDFTYPTRVPEARAAIVQEPWETSVRIKEEEFSRVIPLGLFDYLRKSMANGFMLSLSGGADSTAVACQVKLMVDFGVADLGIDGFKAKLAHIKGLDKCTSKEQLVNRLLVCAYQATKQSSRTTRNAAKKVAAAVGARFFSLNIELIVRLYIKLAEKVIGRKMTWEQDDIPLQNVQARVRAPMIWLLANIFGMLLLSTSNRSEGAVGYCTMDGDTAGGLSPVAGIDKCFLKWWLVWLQNEGPSAVGPLPALIYVTKQQPTAELRPLEQAQTDEKDLMPYDVLNSIEEEAIENNRCPIECYQLIRVGYAQYAPLQISDWVQKFFSKWSINQWKRERLAPALHCDTRNLDPRTWRRSPILSGGYAQELVTMRDYAALDHEQSVSQA